MRIRLAVTFVAALCALAPAANAQTIVDQWASIAVPTPPPPKPVTVDPKTTALLMRDFMNQNCGVRPRCLAEIPRIKAFLAQARQHGMPVIYSIIANTTTADIVPVDGLSASTPYPEQYVTWNFANAPTVSTRATVTKFDAITFAP